MQSNAIAHLESKLKNIINDDRFYVDDTDENSFEWIYYNPDAVSESQFVVNCFDKSLLQRAVCDCINNERFKNNVDIAFCVFNDYVGNECTQYCYDFGDASYSYIVEKFQSKPIAVGLNKTTIDLLLNYKKG